MKKIIAVKRLITINRIQDKSFCLQKKWVSTVYIYYVYIKPKHAYKKNMLCLHINIIFYINIFNL